ncbi:MAG: M48 family metallopeptidase [Clostridia bacterium]|nr:M48 family metallopeptidase [Clostridia bacterium]
MSEIEYTLIRSDRKTTAIRILTDGRIEVRAPKRLPVQEIERFLEEKRNWIEKHRQTMLERIPADVDPRKILYKGLWKTIKPTEERRVYFDGEFFYAPTDMDPDSLRLTMENLMKKLAKTELVPMVYLLAAGLQVSPRRVTVTGAKTKWGSCSDGKNISLSWRLLAAHPREIEYVIIHELCHMKEMNHSAAFWEMVERYVPDWRDKREKLTGVQAWLEAYYG